MQREKLVADVVVWKQAFLDDRKMDLKKPKIDIYFYDFGQKLEIFFLFFCFSKTDREKVFLTF